MCSSVAASCAVTLNQQREQTIQHLRNGGSVAIVPCHPEPEKCTVVENGQVVVKPVQSEVAAE